MIKRLFGKDIDELELADLEEYFNSAKEESDIIEYKSYEVKHQNNHKEKEKVILKTLCAFLNSGGGILIWGAPIESTNENGIKYYKGELSLINRLIHKDNFMSKIVNRIIPITDSVNIHSISEDGVSCAVVFMVKPSMYKPHQSDGRYWMRLDGQTKTAPHHYVEALMRQVKYPNIEGYLAIKSISNVILDRNIGFKTNHKYYKVEVEFFIFNFSGLINEEKLSISLVSLSGKFGNYDLDGFRQKHRAHGYVYFNNNATETLYYGEPYSEKHILFLDPDELKESNNEFEIWLLFGGRKSPQKRSTYKYDFHIITDNPNTKDLLIEKDENKLAIDKVLELGKSKEAMIDELLNRK